MTGHMIAWSRVARAALIEERGESQDSDPPPTWFNLLVEVSEPDEFGQNRWGYSHVSQAAAEQALYRYAPGKTEVRRLPAGY
jgi:hypothetical protein